MPKNRVLIIGLDGVTYEILEPYLNQGLYPSLKRLLDTGIHGTVTATIPPMSSSTWTSIQTGVNPGKHGIFDYMQRKPKATEFEYKNAKSIRIPVLWDLIGKYGKKSCIVNVMMTYPPKDINGVIISGGLTPEKARFYSPETISPEIKEIIDRYIITPYGGYDFFRDNYTDYIERYIRVAEKQKDVTLGLMRKVDWDLCMVLFSCTDGVQHMVWKFIDKRSPLWKESYSGIENPFVAFYKKIDSFIGELVNQCDKHTTIIVCADHGFGPFYARINLNNFLQKHHYLAFRKTYLIGIKQLMLKHNISLVRARRIAHKLRITKLKQRFRDEKQKTLGRAALSLYDLDMTNTKAYAVGTYGQIYINLKGRDPSGIVMPGREYERLRDEIILHLMNLKDPATGKTVIKEVKKKEELYSGFYSDNAPDLVAIPERGYSPNGSIFFTSGNILETTDYASATHEVESGICILAGNNIKSNQNPFSPVSIMDICPTVLALLSVPIPDYLDGSVIGVALTDSKEKSVEPVYEHIDIGGFYTATDEKPLSQEEIKASEKIIENLGYLPKQK
ncbi:MAG: alkaline phosphatase family protein [Spirochaetales bacterium]|nr:alkaline phosphatase family protein [Spirochaetales bacterium]